eukprot:COSAG02_NODE_1875_length_10575_cov_19.141848_4_plen_1839_part_00
MLLRTILVLQGAAWLVLYHQRRSSSTIRIDLEYGSPRARDARARGCDATRWPASVRRSEALPAAFYVSGLCIIPTRSATGAVGLGAMPEFHLVVETCTVAGTERAAACGAWVVAAADNLVQLQDAIAGALGLTGLSFSFFDDGFGEWCAPSSSLQDMPASSPDEPVQIRVQASAAATTPTDKRRSADKEAQAGRRIMLMVARNNSIKGLETNKKLVVFAADLDELIGQLSTKLHLPPDVVVGRWSPDDDVVTAESHSSIGFFLEPTGRIPFSCLDEIPDKARVQVWRPTASASLAEQPATFLLACIWRMEQLGCYDTEGIFRVSGATDAVCALEQQIRESWDAKPALAACTEVHDVAVLMCRWLRNQETLIPAPHVDLVAGLVERDADAASLEAFVCGLPEPGQQILRYVVAFLQEINPETSRMGPGNLGAVFAPTLVKREDPTLMQQHARSDAAFVTLLIQRLIHKKAPLSDASSLAEGVPVSSRASDAADDLPGSYAALDDKPAVDGMPNAEAKLTQVTGASEIREAANREQAAVTSEVTEASGQYTAAVGANITERAGAEAQGAVGQLGDTSRMVDALRSNFGSELDQLEGSLASSYHATEATKRMKAAAARLGDEREELLARLREQSGGDITPRAFLGMLRDDREFGDQLKNLVLSAISDMICGLSLPTIQGERDWGTFEVSGLAVQALGKTPQINVDVQNTGVRVEVVDISIEFQPFQFKIDRHTMPKVKASGTGTVSCVSSALVAFSITIDANKKLEVSDVAAAIEIQELPMQVLDSTKKVAVAAALKVFSKRGKEAVQEEIRQQVQAKMPAIQTKISALTSKFSGQETQLPIADTCTSAAHSASQGLIESSSEVYTAKDTTYPKSESETDPEPKLQPEPESEPDLQMQQTDPLRDAQADLSKRSAPVPVQTPADIRAIQKTIDKQQQRTEERWSLVQQGVDVTVHQVDFPDLLESFMKDTTLAKCDKEYGSCLCLAGTSLLSHTRSRAVCDTNYDEFQADDQAMVVFNVPSRAEAAQLLVFVGRTRAAPVQITVNSKFHLGQCNTGNVEGWVSFDVPGDALRVGSNVIEFSGRGCLYIDELSPHSGGMSHSQRSFDAGATYHVGSLGQTGQVHGEYRVRLRLQGVHPPSGRMISPVVDCTNPVEHAPLSEGICTRATIMFVSCRVPPGTRISIATRSGTTPQYRPQCWTDFASSGSSTVEYIEQRRTLSFEVSTRAVDRYAQVQLTLESIGVHHLLSPEVYSVTIESAVGGNNSNSKNFVTLSNSNQPTSLVRSLYPFKSPASKHARRLDRLKKLTGIERLISGSLTEAQIVERLRLWTQSQWTTLEFDDAELIDSLDPIEIWNATRVGWGRGDERHYAALFVGVASSLGFPSRMVMMGQHWAAEVYSKQYKKWICHDFEARLGSRSCMYFDHGERKESPMSGLEVYQAIASLDIDDIRAHITDAHSQREEPLEHDVFSIVTHIQAMPSFGLLMLCDNEPVFDDALWFSRPDDTRFPFTAQTSRLGDIDYSVNEMRIIVQQTHATAAERVTVATKMEAEPLVKIEIQLEHTCSRLAHFRLHISTLLGSVKEPESDAIEVTEQQLPVVLWLSRGVSKINAWAIDCFGNQCATASLHVVCSLRPEGAATMIQAAWRGYSVRHSSQMQQVRQALRKVKVPKKAAGPKSATKQRSLLTASVRVEESATTHVVYAVCVFDEGKLLAKATRRYSEFHSLRAQILEILRGHFMAESAALIQFPPKATVRGKSSEKLTQQRAQTLQYVASAVPHNPARHLMNLLVATVRKSGSYCGGDVFRAWLTMMFEIELRCRADRPQMRIAIMRWVGTYDDKGRPA